MIPPQLKNLIETELSLKRKPPIEGWCTVEKALVLADLICKERPSIVVEQGVFGGRSLIAMAMALREVGSGVAYGIDAWELPPVLEGGIGNDNEKWWKDNVNLESIYKGFINEVLKQQLTKECRWIRATGQEACDMFHHGEISLFHLDSNHSEEASCRDVMLWEDKITAGGWLIIDDSDWETQRKAITMIKGFGFKAMIEMPTFTVFRK
jgi:hypothetical protein